jgi:SprT protein
MRVTNEVKAKVEAKIQECINIANNRYNRTFAFPIVTYVKRGTTAGTACDSTYTIDLNPILLMENLDTFIERTVVHEFAHLVDGIMNPETRTRTWGRSKRDIHGRTWKNIMLAFGVEPSRCHSYDVSNARTKKRSVAQHVWVCGCGGARMTLGPKRHKNQLQSLGTPYGYYQRGHPVSRCGDYVYTGAQGVQPKKAASTSIPKPRNTNGTSKLDMCRREYNPELNRAANIVAFTEAGCTPAGAATYYAKIKKEFGA